jgi:HEAT repeat protein
MNAYFWTGLLIMVACFAYLLTYLIRMLLLAPKGDSPQGQNKDSVVMRLKRGLIQRDVERKKSAALKLGLMSGATQMSLPALSDELGNINGDPELRVIVANSLANMGPKAAEAMPALRIALKDNNKLVCSAALNACAAIGPAVKELLTDIQKCLKHREPNVKLAAAKAMMEVGELNDDARDVLNKSIRDFDQEISWNERLALAEKLATVDQDAFLHVAPDLLKAFVSEDREVRKKAPRVLAKAGPGLYPLLAETAKSDDAAMRWGAVVAAGALFDESPECRSLLMESFQDDEATVRYEALRAWANRPDQAREEFASIAPLLNDTDPGVRSATITCAKNIGPKLVPALVNFLAKSGEYSRKPVYQVIEHCGETALPDLQHLANDDNVDIRVEAVGCLAAIQHLGDSVVVLLKGAENDPEERVRKEVVWRKSSGGTTGGRDPRNTRG